MALFGSQWFANAGADAFSVDNSMLLNDDDSQYLIRENASNSTTGGSDARKKFTVSLWWKHGNIPSGGQNLFIQRNSSSNYLKCAIAGSGGNEGALQFFSATLGVFSTGDTSAILRDFHAWYHILFYYDSTDSTAGDRARIYLNGTRLTDFQTSATNPSSGAITQFGSNNAQVIGQNQGASGYSDGYMAEMVVIDGQALTPDNFTETDSNGVLRPLNIPAQNFTFGDQGFYLPFTASGALGADYGTTRTAPSVSFIASNSSTANTTSSYTFSGQSLGAAASDRKIFLGASMSAHTVATLAFGTVTIGGVTATQIVAGNADNNDSLHPVAIFVADVPSGTTGDIVLNVGSGSAANCGIAIYRATGVGPIVYSDTTNGGSFPSPNTVSLVAQAPQNSVVLMHGNKNGESVRVTLAGVSEDYDFAVEPDAGGDLAIFGGINTSATSSGAVGLTTSATVDSGSASYFGIATIVIGGVGDTSFKAVNSPTQSSDSPTKNYAVLSPLTHQTNGSLSKGNTQTTASTDQGMSFSSFPVTTGQKVYIEAIVSGSTTGMTGCVKATSAVVTRPNDDFDDLSSANNGDARLLHTALGDVFNSDGNTTVTNYGPDDSVPVHLMIALDLVNDKIYWGDAGVGSSGWSNGSGSFNQSFDNAVGVDLDANLDWYFAFRPFSATIEVNFGATAFTVSPPTGYSSGYSAAIENENRETALTIADGSAYFQATTYSGNGSSNEINQSENSTFQPDLVWLKERSGGNHGTLIDAVRGANKGLYPSLDFVEYTESNLSFDADGFSLSTTGSAAQVNASSQTYIGWQWLAGNSTSSNGDGSITSTVSVNQTAGFSIVTYTGTGSAATVGHGLGAAPEWILTKKRVGGAVFWAVYHAANTSAPETEYLKLNTTDPTADDAGYWNDTAPTSSVFSINNESAVNTSGHTYVAYCWCGKPGFSKFGSYEGNNGADGVFIELSFKPAFFIAKNIDTTGAWLMFDSAREPFNLMDLPLEADDNKAEAASGGRVLDFLSNGVKLRGNSSYLNSNHTFIYMAFAENPFAGATPATAR